MLSSSSVILWEIFDKSQICLIFLLATFSRLQNRSITRCEIHRVLVESPASETPVLEGQRRNKFGTLRLCTQKSKNGVMSLNQAMTLYLTNSTSQIVAASFASYCDLCVENQCKDTPRSQGRGSRRITVYHRTTS
jgi:hypothetical protein